ncbi:MAG TPA: sialidase family protein [Polyangiaceae bacterium]|nr:sialidase family protein [Polyangiaceae bacterium]
MGPVSGGASAGTGLVTAGTTALAGGNAGGSSGGALAGTANGGAAGGSAGSAAGGGSAGSAGSAGVGGSSGASTCGTMPPVVFSKNIRINDDQGNGNQAEVTLATGPNGLAVAAWGDSRGQRTCTFSVSKDGGASWGKNVAIANNGGDFVGDPAAAIDAGGVIYAVCQQYADNGQIRMMTSTDGGDTWSSVRSIQSAPDKPWAGGGAKSGTVFVSWLGNAAGIKRSTDGGQSFGPVQSLGNIIHGTAIVASTSGLVHVPYNLDSDRNQLRYVRSKDGGDTWEKPRDLLGDMGGFCFDCKPRQHPIVGAASDPTGKIVAITWTSEMDGGEGDDDVWLLYSKDGGDTWTDPLRVNDNAKPSRQFQSWVAVDACGRVHVAWTDLRNGQNEVWYARSADPSQGFEPNLQITDDRGDADTDFLGDYKGLAIVGADVLAVWQDTRRDSGDIFAARAPGAAAP